MKTLILNGSPRPNGDTASLIKQIVKDTKGEETTSEIAFLTYMDGEIYAETE